MHLFPRLLNPLQLPMSPLPEVAFSSHRSVKLTGDVIDMPQTLRAYGASQMECLVKP